MTTRTSYRITTAHPNGYRDGDHEVTVTTTKNHQTNRLQKCVSGSGFGCSREYQTHSDTIAIQNLLVENGMRLTKIVKVVCDQCGGNHYLEDCDDYRDAISDGDLDAIVNS